MSYPVDNRAIVRRFRFGLILVAIIAVAAAILMVMGNIPLRTETNCTITELRAGKVRASTVEFAVTSCGHYRIGTDVDLTEGATYDLALKGLLGMPTIAEATPVR